jgi:hypothetical protein
MLLGEFSFPSQFPMPCSEIGGEGLGCVKAKLICEVCSLPRRESSSSTHVGRGGAANIFRPSQVEIEAAKWDKPKWESAVDDEKVKGLADKGKEWLLGKK